MVIKLRSILRSVARKIVKLPRVQLFVGMVVAVHLWISKPPNYHGVCIPNFIEIDITVSEI